MTVLRSLSWNRRAASSVQSRMQMRTQRGDVVGMEIPLRQKVTLASAKKKSQKAAGALRRYYVTRMGPYGSKKLLDFVSLQPQFFYQ